MILYSYSECEKMSKCSVLFSHKMYVELTYAFVIHPKCMAHLCAHPIKTLFMHMLLFTIQYSFSKLRFCPSFKVLFCVLWFSTLQCKTMDTILWQYVNKQIMEKIQGLKNFDQNSHDVQLLYVCCLENCLSSIRCSGNHKFVYIRGNVDFNIFVILDWHWLHF